MSPYWREDSLTLLLDFQNCLSCKNGARTARQAHTIDASFQFNELQRRIIDVLMLVAPPPCAPSPPLKLPRLLCKSVKHHNLSSLPGVVNIVRVIVMDMTILVKMVLACPIVQFACVSSPIGVSFKCFWLILREMLFGWIGTFGTWKLLHSNQLHWFVLVVWCCI